MGERRAHVKNSDEWWAEVGEHTQKHSKKEEIRKKYYCCLSVKISQRVHTARRIQRNVIIWFFSKIIVL